MDSSIRHLVDVHAHLCDAAFDDDREDILERAGDAGIDWILSVGETIADARRNLQLAMQHPMIRPAAGLYPTHLDLNQATEMGDFIRTNRHKLVAIGEVGLDYWAIKSADQRALQGDIFSIFISLSKDLGLPLNVHSRSAGRHAINMLLDKGASHVQLHAFDGKYGTAMPAVEAGYYFSIPPSVVRSRQKQKLVKQLPLSCLLVESDSPVLGPVPGERNEPANLPLVIQTIAEIKSITPQEVTAAVMRNTTRLYGT